MSIVPANMAHLNFRP